MSVMRCGTCQKDIEVPTETCPFCNAALSDAILDLESDLDDAIAGGGLDDALKALDKKMEAGGFAAAEIPQPAHAQKRPPAPPAKNQAHMYLIAAAAALFLAYRFGALDSLLGTAAPPAESAQSTASADAVEGTGGREPQWDPPAEEEIEPAEEPDAGDPEPAEAAPPAGGPLSPPKAQSEGSEAARRAEPAPAALPEEWWFYGKIFDLLTLERIAHVDLMFIGGGSDFSTTTDAQGEFKIRLPILEGGGYDLIIEREGYSDQFLIDGAKSYGALTRERRNRLWARIPPKQKTWSGEQAKWERRDLVLFPSPQER